MDIDYAPDMLDELVRMEMERREKEGDLGLTKEYHKLRESLYNLPDDDDDREEGFEEVDRKVFATLGLGSGIEEILEEFPLIPEKIGLMEIRKAYNREEESVNISNRHLETDQKATIIRLRPQCFFNPNGFVNVIRHEFMHLNDILDEEFGYNTRRFGKNPSEDAFIRDRYRIMWDIYIEARLAREGRDATDMGRDGCWKEFNLLYVKLPEEDRKTIFETLWNREKMTHSGIAELASDPYKLLQSADISTKEGDAETKKKVALPGSPCPLCKFPTYHPVHDFSPEALEKIKKDFPKWEEDWACERCMDLYNLKPFERQEDFTPMRSQV
jgi:hypothetical protein